MSAVVEIRKGLEGVVADSTALSLVDGEGGHLYYRGYPVEMLAQRQFVEVAHLLLFGELPDEGQLEAFEQYLWQAGQLPAGVASTVRELARLGEHPMATLQAITPLLALDAPANSPGRSPPEQEGLVVAARVPAAIAAIHAVRSGREPAAYPQSRRYGARYLQLINNRAPTPDELRAFECMQVLQLDHGFNASTFTARVVTSTLAPAASALSAAMGALYGPLHGAADQGALEMALEVGSPERAAEFVATCLATGRKVMGMGHREYRLLDPRASVLKRMAEKVAVEPTLRRLYETLSAVDAAFVSQTSLKRRALRANMEFYKGVVCLGLGIPKELFTATFAASRVFGWLAHVVEQRTDNRLIRPSAHYVGPAPRDLA
ncbi:MAG TPA: citrate/2-methylcitrate synthase [Steroidobacteraceae bacterium]|nr:citrate/2-methylcitrate synthase [Steroidobacteraceae bacterium]